MAGHNVLHRRQLLGAQLRPAKSLGGHPPQLFPRRRLHHGGWYPQPLHGKRLTELPRRLAERMLGDPGLAQVTYQVSANLLTAASTRVRAVRITRRAEPEPVSLTWGRACPPRW
ncbi:MAG: hypothetical protein JO115_06190 [Pseudonocardiales bacterium]|nr:hypothetical protein [Pseudonocardiales bacterium]